MSIKHGLLALLADESQHGYALKTEFEERTGSAWTLNIGQVYTTLQRLERDGLVTSLEAGDDGVQRYELTPAGHEALEEWWETPLVAASPPRDELAIKVLLAVAAEDVDVRDLLQRQRTAAVELLQDYTRQKASADPDSELAIVMLLDALIFRTEAEVRWLDACEARLAARR